MTQRGKTTGGEEGVKKEKTPYGKKTVAFVTD